MIIRNNMVRGKVKVPLLILKLGAYKTENYFE